MPDQYVLLAVVAAIYVFDCARWWRADVVVLRAWTGGTFKLARPGAQLGNDSGGFVWNNPLPPLGTVVGTGNWPLSFGPAGVFGFTYQTTPGQNAPPATFRYVPWERLTTLERSEKRLFVDDEPLVDLPSKRAAKIWHGRLARLVSLSTSDRAAALDEILRSTLDDEAACRRRSAVDAAVLPLRTACNLLFVYIVAAIVMLLNYDTARMSWPLWLAGLFAATGLIAGLYVWAAAKLRAPGEGLSWGHALLCFVAPLSAVRAVDAITGDAYAEFHPVAVARRLMEPRAFLEFFRAVLLDLENPLRRGTLAGERDPAAWPAVWRETEEWSRMRQYDLLAEVVADLGLVLDEVLAPPRPESHEVKSYCPRCREQFAGDEGACPSCPGIERLPFPDA